MLIRALIRRAWLLLPLLGLWAGACGGLPCRSTGDCPIGYYCVLDASGGGKVTGECVQDCVGSTDCDQPESSAYRAICTNEGKCEVEARPPKLRVLEPEVDTLYAEGTRRIRVSGEVETAGERVTVTVSARAVTGCFGGASRSIQLDNPDPGQFAVLPFIVDDVVLDPGVSEIDIAATVVASGREAKVQIEVPCPGCAQISISSPLPNHTAPGLELRLLEGTVSPLVVPSAIWRIHGPTGGLFDGRMPLNGGFFRAERLPLFAGQNRVEVLVTGVGEGLGEQRCSLLISSGTSLERGLRGLLMWDTGSDLDLHLVGPGGRYGDPSSSLSVRSPLPFFGGDVVDDFDGYGPETLLLESPPDGVYGLVAEPAFDANGQGASAFLRLVFDGRQIGGAIGPRYVSADRGELWVAGKLTLENGNPSFELIDEVVSASAPPATPPSAWPTFF